METISIGLDDSMWLQLLPSFLIIIGFFITIWQIRKESDSQQILLESQNEWKRAEKIREQQEKYFDDLLALIEEIAVAKKINKNLFIKLQSFWIKSLRLFKEKKISAEFEKALNMIDENNLTSVPSSGPSIRKYNKASEEVDEILASYLDLLIEYFQSDN